MRMLSIGCNLIDVHHATCMMLKKILCNNNAPFFTQKFWVKMLMLARLLTHQWWVIIKPNGGRIWRAKLVPLTDVVWHMKSVMIKHENHAGGLLWVKAFTLQTLVA